MMPSTTEPGSTGEFTNARVTFRRMASYSSTKPRNTIGSAQTTGTDMFGLASVGHREAPYQKSSQEVGGAGWSGRDQRDHIVYARDGKLFRRVNHKDHELIDFNERVPEPSVAPAWAQRWYRRSK